MYKLYFYVPESDLGKVKEALFAAGAGQIGNYSRCSWETKGTGQFLPNDESDPTIGQRGKVEKLEEYKVEMVVSSNIAQKAIEILKAVHPYEEPAYGLIEIVT